METYYFEPFVRDFPFMSRPLWNVLTVVLIVAVAFFAFRWRRRKRELAEWEAEDAENFNG